MSVGGVNVLALIFIFRCADGFDHHCVWINNDVAKVNYKQFIASLVAIEVQLAMQIVLGALAISGSFAAGGRCAVTWQSVINNNKNKSALLCSY